MFNILIKETIKVGTADIELSGCGAQAAGNTTQKVYNKAVIIDSSEELSSSFRSVQVEVKKENGDFLTTGSHHNWCDNYLVLSQDLDTIYAVIAWPEKVEGDWYDVPKARGSWVKYGEDNWKDVSPVGSGLSLIHI